MKTCFILLMTVSLLAHGSLAEAQFSAQLQGTVHDQTGGVMPGATVTLVNAETGVSLTTVSDANGGFRLPNLAPGTYQAKIDLAGFRTATVDVQVLTQQTANVVVTLEVASATETVSVTAESPTIDVADSRVHATFRGAPRSAVPGAQLPGPHGDRAGRDRSPAGGLVGTRVNTGGIDREIDPGNTLIYSLGAERKLPVGLVGGVTYNGSHTWNGIVGTDFNRTPGDLLDGTLDRLNPNFASMFYEFNGNEVWYNALILNLRRNLTGRTSFQTSYTLSKVEDLGQGGTRINRDAPFSLVSQNFYQQYKAVADHDRRHRFSFAGSFHLPSFSGGNAVTRAMLAGWMISGIGIFESGPPINIVNRAAFAALRDASGRFLGYAPNSGDYNADGFNYDYPNAPSGDFSGSHSRDEYVAGLFAAADFPRPEPGTLGNLPRFAYRGPGFAQVDLGFVKDSAFPVVGARGKLQLRVDMFNIFNRVNLGNVNGDLNSATFGRSTGTSQPRVVQFGVRVSY